MPIHPAADRGFARSAEAYHRGRPSYAPRAIRWLREELALGPGQAVVDVAAGTGKLTEALLSYGAPVIAVEPVAAMREQLAARLRGVRVLDGIAERLPPLGDIVVITVGQALHWFDLPAALAEFRRVLPADGRLVVAWNVRDRRQPLWQAVTHIIEPHRGATPQHDDRWRGDLLATQTFAPVAAHRVRHVQELSLQGLCDRVSSTSFIATLDQVQHERVLQQVRAAANGQKEPLRLGYVTEIDVFAPAAAGRRAQTIRL